jgi:hypothetical protein
MPPCQFSPNWVLELGLRKVIYAYGMHTIQKSNKSTSAGFIVRITVFGDFLKKGMAEKFNN